ncbi:hypothetical protein [Arcanobacterium phocae]|uniref:hypothetical protein n=1 Tax=Arcanobacterium phocae TaxID=131112 RepID=UPI001C0EC977|nr:hypothetical protein [Arcanobacterium phocae]
MKFNFKSRISGIVAFLLAFVMAGSTYLAVLQIDDEVNRELAVTASEAQIAAIVITGIVFVVVFLLVFLVGALISGRKQQRDQVGSY